MFQDFLPHVYDTKATKSIFEFLLIFPCPVHWLLINERVFISVSLIGSDSWHFLHVVAQLIIRKEHLKWYYIHQESARVEQQTDACRVSKHRSPKRQTIIIWKINCYRQSSAPGQKELPSMKVLLKRTVLNIDGAIAAGTGFSSLHPYFRFMVVLLSGIF